MHIPNKLGLNRLEILQVYQVEIPTNNQVCSGARTERRNCCLHRRSDMTSENPCKIYSPFHPIDMLLSQSTPLFLWSLSIHIYSQWQAASFLTIVFFFFVVVCLFLCLFVSFFCSYTFSYSWSERGQCAHRSNKSDGFGVVCKIVRLDWWGESRPNFFRVITRNSVELFCG